MINREAATPDDQGEPARRGRQRPAAGAVWLAALAAVAILATATALIIGYIYRGASPVPTMSPVPGGGVISQVPGPTRSAPEPVLVQPPDYSSPVSVAAGFFTAWASVDSVSDGPGTALMRCATLTTPALARQLRTGQIAPFEWQIMRDHRLVSTVHVQSVTHPVGAPAPSRNRVYLSIYAERVTTTLSGRTVSSAGASVVLTRTGNRWLVAQLLFY